MSTTNGHSSAVTPPGTANATNPARDRLLTAVAAHMGRQRKGEREHDAAVVDAVIDALLPIVRRHVEREWSGNALLAELAKLKGDE